MAVRSTSMMVEVSRPSKALDLTAHDAPMLSELGFILVDSLTVHARVTPSP
jgi:hypothetical protein